jgi:cell division protein FtsQ
MLQHFKDINRLLQPLHVRILTLELTPYFTWKLRLDNGMMLQLGHKDILTRLAHFVKVYPKIVGSRVADIEYVDLRYPNGVAVRWKV